MIKSIPKNQASEKKEERHYPLLEPLVNFGDSILFLLKVLKGTFTFWFTRPREFLELLRQCFMIGNKSLGLVMITGLIMGLVLALQSRPVLVEFGAQSWLPSMVCISFIREIGPVITGLICAGKVGSGIGAEVSSMKVTEQIEAMEVSATNPFKFIVLTRVLACSLMVPLLVVFSDIAGIVGAYICVVIYGQGNFSMFFTQGFSTMEFTDFLPAIIKSVFFGFAIGIVGCYKGYYAGKGTESVGLAANSAVVVSSLLIFFIDLIAVQIVNLIETF